MMLQRIGWTPRLQQHRQQLRPTICRSSSSAVVVRGPPDNYDFRAESAAASAEIVARFHPELLDLVRNGTLVAVPRRRDYVERRSDGYQEPELVYLVGTAHVSTQSADDARRVIEAIRPQNVVVELCSSRTAIMYDDGSQGRTDVEEGHGSDHGNAEQGNGSAGGNTAGSAQNRANNVLNLSGGSLIQAFTRTIQLGGTQALILRLILGQLSSRLSAQIGVRSGEEFRSARRAAEACDAQLVLGDRPIEVSLRRAWDALGWRQRWRLAKQLTGSLGSLPQDGSYSEADLVEALKEDDVISAFFAQLSSDFPEVVGPLIHERDVFLAWSLKRSKAVNGCQTVVGVMGKGHLRGVVYALMRDQGELRFRDLAGSRRSKIQRSDVVKRIAFEVAVAGSLALAWVYIPH